VMAEHTKVTSRTERKMEKELSNGQMDQSISGHGEEIRCMDWECTAMERRRLRDRENGSMAPDKDGYQRINDC